MIEVEIDNGSGFCFGVTTAISKAEEELHGSSSLYCLGDIVHNGTECERLKKLGLITIEHDDFAKLNNAKVLLRAHGEPPQTYLTAKENNIQLIDATCPVVLRLQKRIKKEGRAVKKMTIHFKTGKMNSKDYNICYFHLNDLISQKIKMKSTTLHPGI